MNLKESAPEWFMELQDMITAGVESFESTKMVEKENKREGWHQRHRTIYGDTFEKAVIAYSCVSGEFKEEFAKEIPGTENNKEYWASGISVIFHPMNPHVPAMHMNTRYIITGKEWFGGGFDFTPCLPDAEYETWYHNKVKELCDAHDESYYEDFRKKCDEYFFLPHRNETRGIGGIFYEYFSPQEMSFDFHKAVGKGFFDTAMETFEKFHTKEYTDADKAAQQIKRGRYVEFNLLNDRGTRFGLKTGGDTEAILASLPPTADWR